MRNPTTEEPILTGAMILELCQFHELVRCAIPEGFELLLPRFRLESQGVVNGFKSNEVYRWVVDCWWRSSAKGPLGYFVKIDLLDKSVQEFRELSGDIAVSGMNISATEMAYLDRYNIARNESMEAANALDELWKALVPDELQEYAMQHQEPPTVFSYLLPVESLSCWNWETLRDLILKRENTTLADIQDYIDYKNSGSDKRYIAPKHRADAKARGLKFWRDEDDI